MRIWLVSDTHFGHKRIIEYGRPEDFEQKIKTNLLESVKPEDLLIHLGDVCIGGDKEHSNWFKDNLGCKTLLVRGNHDSKTLSWYMNNGWDMMADRYDLRFCGKKLSFSHEPLLWDHTFDINYHGHLHTIDFKKVRKDGSLLDYGRNILVSMEMSNYKPMLLK